MLTTIKRKRTLPGSLAAFAAKTEHFGSFIAAAVLIGVFPIAVVKALYRPLWSDEIASALIAQLPRASQILDVCRSGFDGQPPAYDYLVRATVRLLGNDALGIRLPSIAGFMLFCFSLYWFVRQRTSRLYGVIAILVACITDCWSYATEGRPYGLLLGFTGIAAVSWQAIAMNKHRAWALAGLGLSLAGAFSIHYYAPLLFGSFALAEIVRSYLKRRLDFPVWCVLAAPFLILIPYLPFIRGTRIHSGTLSVWWATPAWYTSLTMSAIQFLDPSLMGLIGIVCVYFLFHAIMRSYLEPDSGGINYPSEFLPDIALALSLTLLSIMGIALSKWVTHVFFPRYIIACMFGLTALVTFAMWMAFSGKRQAASAVAGVLLCSVFAHTAISDLRNARDERANPPREAMPNRIPAAALNDRLPIVVTGLHEFFEMRYYAGPALAPRLCYLSSEQSANRFLGFTNGERIAIGSVPFFGMCVADYNTFLANHKTFYVFGAPDWLQAQLLADSARLTLLNYSPDNTPGARDDFLFRVEHP